MCEEFPGRDWQSTFLLVWLLSHGMQPVYSETLKPPSSLIPWPNSQAEDVKGKPCNREPNLLTSPDYLKAATAIL